jgi:monoamine oxidase
MGLVLGGVRVDRASWTESPLNTLPEALRSTTPDRLGSSLLRENPLQGSSDWRSAAMAVRDQPATDFYRAQGLDDQALAWIDANNSYGNRLQETSMLSLFRVGNSIGRAMAMRQPVYEAGAGNQRIPEAMAKALRSPPRYGERVTQVRRLADGSYRVRCTGDVQHEAAAVICTLPLPALRTVRFEPGLPANQAEAVNTVAYHQVTQAHFVAREPYWAASGDPAGWWTDGPLGRVFARKSGEDGEDLYNITCWINGASCDRYDTLAPDGARQLVLNDFHELVPAAKGRVELSAMVSWANEPLSGGSWAIWRPGEISRFADVLAQPLGRIFFAGEHTAYSNSGMEGAAESGERAALEAMRALA